MSNRLLTVASLILLSACGGDSATTPPPPPPPPPVQQYTVTGGGQTDTIQARLSQALVVQLRDGVGQPLTGTSVRFDAAPNPDTTRRFETAIGVRLPSNLLLPFISSITTTTDSTGRAQVLVGLGTITGPTSIRVSVPVLAKNDTVPFVVLPGKPNRLAIAVKDTVVAPGSSYSLGAVVTDRFKNPTNDPITYSAGSGVAVSASGTVTAGSSIARAAVAISSSIAVDTARVSVMPKWGLVVNRYDNDFNSNDDFGVFTVKIDGSEFRKIAASPSIYMGPQQSLAAASVAYYVGNPAANAAIRVVDAQGTNNLIAGGSTLFVTAYLPRWSADGQWIYFMAQRTLSDSRSLWRIRPNGSGLDSITAVNASGYLIPPAPSPNGRFVAVDETAGLRVFDLNLRTSQVLPRCPMPRYSPDGSRIVCLADYSAVVMNADGTNRRVVPNVGCTVQGQPCITEVSGIDWSPDGQWLIMIFSTVVITLVNPENGDQIPITVLRLFEQASFAR